MCWPCGADRRTRSRGWRKRGVSTRFTPRGTTRAWASPLLPRALPGGGGSLSAVTQPRPVVAHEAGGLLRAARRRG
jgi:hypothetical protein